MATARPLPVGEDCDPREDRLSRRLVGRPGTRVAACQFARGEEKIPEEPHIGLGLPSRGDESFRLDLRGAPHGVSHGPSDANREAEIDDRHDRGDAEHGA